MSESRPTVILSEVKWKAVINGGESEGINVVNCPGIVIDGFEVLGARADGVSMNTDSGTIRNCWVHNNGGMGVFSFWRRPVRSDKAVDLGAFAFVPSLATEKAPVGWEGWPYRFAPKGAMELPDLWAPPQASR